ncbi:MAG: hypothetical protein ACYDH1_19545, partial [Anaerolineaceae bacterium]
KEAENKADEKLSQLKSVMDQDIDKMLKHQKITDENLNMIQGQMRTLLEKAIDNSRKVDLEAREETVRELIIRSIKYFRKTKRPVFAEALINHLISKYNLEFHDCFDEIIRMERQGILSLSDKSLEASTSIRLVEENI